MRRPNTTEVLATFALIVSAAGGTAAAATLVTTRDIADRTIKARDVAKTVRPSLRGPEGSAGDAGSRGAAGQAGAAGAGGATGPSGADGPEGPQGPIGATGEAGETGARGLTGEQGDEGAPGPASTEQGETGPSGSFTQVFTRSASVTVPPGSTGEVAVRCPVDHFQNPTKLSTGGSASWDAVDRSASITISAPTLDTEDVQDAVDGYRTASGWHAVGQNSGTSARVLTAFAMCVGWDYPGRVGR
jgi:hypothetical protein